MLNEKEKNRHRHNGYQGLEVIGEMELLSDEFKFVVENLFLMRVLH